VRTISRQDAAVGEEQLVRGTRSPPVGLHAHEHRRAWRFAPPEVEAEVADERSAVCRDHHVVGVPVAQAGQIRVDAELAGVEAEHAPVIHRDDEQRPVREPAEARRHRLDADDLLHAAFVVDGEDVPPEEVREPPAAVVPARALEEPAAGEQGPHALMVAGSSRWTSSSARRC
jgi:hypothetical protein